MKKILKFWPFFVFIVVCIVYYWKVFLKGFVPFPGDLLVGAYLPWLDSKWGFPTGVPVKNPLISDVFSQFYIWKSLISEGWRHVQIPLWNPYSYSGYPMLANFHSGVFYPLNLIYMLLGDIRGWSFLVIFPSLASAVTMYLFLKQIKVNKIGAVIGSIIYAYSGFAISWAQFITAAQAMVWMPLVLSVLEKYFESKRVWLLYWLPFIFFLLITSGHFQIMVYVSILTVVYFVWKWLEKKDFKLIWGTVIPGVLSVGLVAFQLLPTFELTGFGLRTSENAISGHNFGLLPIKYLTTLIAPDYFGNPATGNFFGFFNYHETIFYCGVLAIFCLVLSLFLLKSNKYVRFFGIAAVIAVLFGFDTPLGRAVYTFKVPGISTSDAGRISVIFSLSMAVLVGMVISNLEKISLKKILVAVGIVGLFYTVIFYLARFNDGIFVSSINPNLTLLQRRAVTLRNLILPGALVAGYSLVFVLAKKWKVMTWALLVMICLEMFRFGWKYIPFVPERIVFPETPITSFIEEKGKTEIFRIERERAEIMPPATWMQYRFMSASGYDPMARADYVGVYQEKINGNFSGNISRYSEPERYDAKALGEFNVKYLLAVKRDELGRIKGDVINHSINLKEWKKVFETEGTAVLENTLYQPRVRFLNSKTGEVKITSYLANTVKISYFDGAGKTLLLADSWYPGWKAFENKKEVAIEKCEGIFRCIKLTDHTGEVVFDYQPESFWLGIKISLVCLIATLAALIGLRKKK
ncbi:MAG TPA: YfhO family protein [Spirochaetia bacterium]|nr:YfhO family protein [Spirochaetia bacterium]